jgi:hypothetical protein
MKGVEPLTFPIFNRDALSNLSYFVHLSSAMKGVEPLTFPICNRDALSNLSYYVHLSSALEGSRTPNLPDFQSGCSIQFELFCTPIECT